MHGLQSFVSTHSEENDKFVFHPLFAIKMLLTSAFSKEYFAISLEECVLVLKVFTTAARKLRVKKISFFFSLRG